MTLFVRNYKAKEEEYRLLFFHDQNFVTLFPVRYEKRIRLKKTLYFFWRKKVDFRSIQTFIVVYYMMCTNYDHF